MRRRRKAGRRRGGLEAGSGRVVALIAAQGSSGAWGSQEKSRFLAKWAKYLISLRFLALAPLFWPRTPCRPGSGDAVRARVRPVRGSRRPRGGGRLEPLDDHEEGGQRSRGVLPAAVDDDSLRAARVRDDDLPRPVDAADRAAQVPRRPQGVAQVHAVSRLLLSHPTLGATAQRSRREPCSAPRARARRRE